MLPPPSLDVQKIDTPIGTPRFLRVGRGPSDGGCCFYYAATNILCSMGLDKDLAAVTERLEPGEEVIAAVQGQHVKDKGGQQGGTLAATNHRLAFYRKNMGGFTFDTYPYPAITSVDQGKNLLGPWIKLTVSNASIEVKQILNDKGGVETGKIADAVRARLGQGAVAAPVTASAPDPTDQLRKLAELRDAGILSEDEFAAKKTEILARL